MKVTLIPALTGLYCNDVSHWRGFGRGSHFILKNTEFNVILHL